MSIHSFGLADHFHAKTVVPRFYSDAVLVAEVDSPVAPLRAGVDALLSTILTGSTPANWRR